MSVAQRDGKVDGQHEQVASDGQHNNSFPAPNRGQSLVPDLPQTKLATAFHELSKAAPRAKHTTTVRPVRSTEV